MNTPHWNSILIFYIKRLLVITYNIYRGNSIKPLSDLIIKAKTTYDFSKPSNVKVPRAIQKWEDPPLNIERAALVS